MPEYAKMKNSELEALLKERKLPHQGRKDEKVARLVEADMSTSKAPDSRSTETQATTKKTASKSESIEAPIQKPNSGETSNTKKTEPAEIAAGADSPTVEATSNGEKPPDGEEEAKPATSFSANLASTSLDEEIARRRKRAEKFGMSEQESDAIKSLERQKKFGTGPATIDEPADGTSASGVNRLDEALPEIRQRGAKRGHADNSAETYDDPGLKRRRGGFGGRGRGRGRRGFVQGDRDNGRVGGSTSWMTEADKAAAEKRKAKFST